MKYIFRKNLSGELYCVRGKVKEFDSCYKCSKYYDKNKLKEKGYSIVVVGIDEEKNKECLKYL